MGIAVFMLFVGFFLFFGVGFAAYADTAFVASIALFLVSLVFLVSAFVILYQ